MVGAQRVDRDQNHVAAGACGLGLRLWWRVCGLGCGLRLRRDTRLRLLRPVARVHRARRWLGRFGGVAAVSEHSDDKHDELSQAPFGSLTHAAAI